MMSVTSTASPALARLPSCVPVVVAAGTAAAAAAVGSALGSEG